MSTGDDVKEVIAIGTPLVTAGIGLIATLQQIFAKHGEGPKTAIEQAAIMKEVADAHTDFENAVGGLQDELDQNDNDADRAAVAAVGRAEGHNTDLLSVTTPPDDKGGE